MKLYADAPGYRGGQLVRDGLVLLWIALWVRAGVWIHELVSRLAGPARTIQRAGEGFARPFRDAGERVEDVPVVGDALRSPFDAAAGAGRVLAEAGAAQRDTVETLALWLAVLLALIPISSVLLRYVPARLRWAREASAAGRLLVGDGGLELLALRAVARRSLDELRRAVPDPAGAWARGDHAPLAELELRELGVRARRRR